MKPINVTPENPINVTTIAENYSSHILEGTCTVGFFTQKVFNRHVYLHNGQDN